MNALKALHEQGQSPWLDFMRRNLIGAALDKLINEDGVSGITSNPSIFEKAIGHSDDYDDQLKSLLAKKDYSTAELFEELSVHDIRAAADALRPTYEKTKKHDGYISLEVSPYLALKTAETIAEAQHLWKKVDKANLMVKVPGTPAGLPAIEELIAQGININVTLLFGIETYEKVAEAYIKGLERYSKTHSDLSGISSVASFFVSRIDAAVEKLIDNKVSEPGVSADQRDKLEWLRGKVAIANAKLAYKKYEEIYASDRWRTLAAKGAQPQRMLWASTGTKNKAFSDVLYVETLIGPHTVNTMPPETMDAFRDHGKVARTIDLNIDEASAVLDSLKAADISLDTVTGQLVDDGVQLFADAADKLFGAVEGKRQKLLDAQLTTTSIMLPDALGKAVEDELEAWRHEGKIRKLWAKDASLWTGDDEGKWLGWLDVVQAGARNGASIASFGREIAAEGMTHALLIGMGGSSLGPEVIVETFGVLPDKPKLHVIDSTDPRQIATVQAALDLDKTIFIVSSKSGSTMEPNVLMDHFFEAVSKKLGPVETGRRFVAVTDPGSNLEKVAKEKGFRHIFSGDPTIGGRFSVLSPFGLVPAAAMGVDIGAFLASTALAVHSCGPEIPPSINPGIRLGTVLGVAAKHGRDKVTILAGPGIQDFGAWAEQLLAESTGKIGKGLIPVDAEPLGPPDVYSNDRVFVHLALTGKADAAETGLKALADAGHPVVRIALSKPEQIAQEFFRWEIAVAVAGSIIGINTFNQPDVEAAKSATRTLFEAYEKSGKLEEATPLITIDGIGIYGEEKDKALLLGGGTPTLESVLTQHFKRLGAGDYAAFLAFLPREEKTIAAFQAIRQQVRDHAKSATVVGFGPRFLHSTGQAYKGGPNTGVFLQVTCDHKTDIPAPGHSYSFAVIEKAQAAGDLGVLVERGRRTLRLHLGTDLYGGLDRLKVAVEKAAASLT